MVIKRNMGAFILEHVREIMADICNNNYTNISCPPLSHLLTCSKIKVPKYVSHRVYIDYLGSTLDQTARWGPVECL